MAAAHPFDWHLHSVWLLALLGLVAGSLWATQQQDAEPPVWSDVEREIARADRRDRRQGSGGPPTGLI